AWPTQSCGPSSPAATSSSMEARPDSEITGWEAGRPISEPDLRRVEEMGRLRGALAEGMRVNARAKLLEPAACGCQNQPAAGGLHDSGEARLMETILRLGHRVATGAPLTRRQLVRVGAIGLGGLTLPGLFRLQRAAAAAPPTAT